MRCLTPKETIDLFGRNGFSVMSNPDLCRNALVLESTIASRQNRIGGRPTPDVSHLARFAEALNRWHPPNAHRLLWVDHWNNDFPSAYEFFIAARVGLGDARSLSDAPGHYFDPHPYDEQDQTKISPEQTRQTGILIGLMSLIMVNRWDGWLVADGSSDRIEFWEGNIFFYSSEGSRLTNANSLMDQFGCPRGLV
jgi:hypothetical protein